MPNSQTPNYGLSQWVKQDKVLMEDFNADNAKIDAALIAEANARMSLGTSLGAALAQKGNCRIVWGTYTGNNLAGEAHPTTLTFDGRPIAVFLLPAATTGGYPMSMFLLCGAGAAYSCPHYPNSGNLVSWGENSVSWYSDSADFQLNAGRTYAYAALLAADA